MVTLQTLRREKRSEILQIVGSVARDEANPNSDLDLLVEWDSGRSLLDHSRLALDLEALLNTPVEIGTEKFLHRYVRNRILSEAIPL